MRRTSPLLALIGAIALSAGMVGPAAAEDPPPADAYLRVDVTFTGYLGGIVQQWIRLGANCPGIGSFQIDVDLAGNHGVSDPAGPFPAGTDCHLSIVEWPGPGAYGEWLEDVVWSPGQDVHLLSGTTTVEVTLERYYTGEWPPQTDTGQEHRLDMVVDQVRINRNGGINVTGAARCDASALMDDGLWVYDMDGAIIANVNWKATQYAGRRAITASYESGIGFECFDRSRPDDWGSWGTYFAYPSGAEEWIYAQNGKFGSGVIQIRADAGGGIAIVTQDWRRRAFMGAPYDPGCDDQNLDGFCVTAHAWYGWAQADLRPVRVR